MFQLPYLPFPEGGQQVRPLRKRPPARLPPLGRPALELRGDEGRAEEWVDDLAGMPTATVLDAAAAAGFAGLYVDRFGYQDGGRARERGARPGRLRAARQRVGPAFVLRPQGACGASRPSTRRKTRRVRQAVLEPFGFEESGFLPLERSRANGLWFAWADAPNAELRIVNPSNTQRTAVFGALLDRVGGPPAEVVVTFPARAPIRTGRPRRSSNS